MSFEVVCSDCSLRHFWPTFKKAADEVRNHKEITGHNCSINTEERTFQYHDIPQVEE